MTIDKVRLHTLLGNHPGTLALKQGKLTSDLVTFDFADVKVPNTAFKPLVREAKFDLGELAITTFLLAKAFDKPYVLLPATVVGRAQHHTIAYNGERGVLRPQDLKGKRVGVRSYTVTTGVWVRGILQEEFGIAPDSVHWVTFEDPHVAEFKDPDFVERAPAGRTLVDMLLAGELDAAVVGDSLPDPRLKQLIPDAEKAAEKWARRHGGVAINHMVVIRESIARTRPDVVREVYRLFAESRKAAPWTGDPALDPLRFGIEANRKALEAIIGYACDQRMIPRRYTVDELFADVRSALPE